MKIFFVIDEITKAIDNLKRGKSHGEDGILNEYFIEFQDYLLPILCNLFNCILHTGFSQVLGQIP